MSDEAQLEKLADWLNVEWGERPEAMEVVHRERTIWPGSPDEEIEILICRYAQPNGYRGLGITGDGVMTYAFIPVEAIAGKFDWDDVPIEVLKRCHAGVQIYMRRMMRQQMVGEPAESSEITEEDRAYEAAVKTKQPEVQRLVRVTPLDDWRIYMFRQHTEEYGDEIYVTDGRDGHCFSLDDSAVTFGADWFFLGDAFFKEVGNIPTPYT